MMYRIFQIFVPFLAAALISANIVFADRIKDLTSLAGIRTNQLVGYGVVVGLAGSGDGNTGITLQSMQSLVCYLHFGACDTSRSFQLGESLLRYVRGFAVCSFDLSLTPRRLGLFY